MNYHIGTMLIYEHFDEKDDCPVCRIKKAVDQRLTESYLGEGVMEDSTRKEVNKLGFCAWHFDNLFAMRSKLGLALQSSTILKTIEKSIFPAKDAKSAKKLAETLEKREKTCVVCKYLDEHMERYYKTVAEVYSNDEKFRERITDGQGFCLTHFSALLKYSSFAGKRAKEYVSDIIFAENKRLSSLSEDLAEFCDRHDYRNSDKPLNGGKDALKNTRKTFYGL